MKDAAILPAGVAAQDRGGTGGAINSTPTLRESAGTLATTDSLNRHGIRTWFYAVRGCQGEMRPRVDRR
jgi:hypothetical protein